MISRWNDAEAAAFAGKLGLRVYTSRLLGRDPSLVLHGGGNTSFKQDEVLFVKASGSDLARVDDGMFCALPLTAARRLLEREGLTNAEMMTLLASCMVQRSDRRPSIETLMHAILPYRYVEHTHADSVLAVINTANARRIAATVYGDLAPLVPYRHSGVELARACTDALQEKATAQTIGLLLQFHGVVAFGDTAQASYGNMIRLVTLAEDYLKANHAWHLSVDNRFAGAPQRPVPATFRGAVARFAGLPLAVHPIQEPLARAFARRDDLPVLSQHGPSTPQHAVHTKRVPQLGWDVQSYAARYTEYITRTLGSEGLARIDPAPRIVIDPEAGVLALGVEDRAAHVAADFYVHDMEVMMRASAHDRYVAAPEQAIAQAELEYGGFETKIREQAGLRGEFPPREPEAPQR
jgi:rhamnose utilization protein RhaD (predicted bifunctional aldolase and dehydrogenase)